MLLALLAALCAAEPAVHVKGRAAAPGEVLLVVVERHAGPRPPEGRFGGEPLRFHKTRRGAWLAFAGIDLDVPPGPRRLQVDLGDRVWDNEVLVEEKDFPTQRLRVRQRYVTPPADDASRAEEESKRLRALFDSVVDEPLFGGSFVSPIEGAASSRFGERRVFNDQPRAPHSGADLRAPLGAPIHAPAGGRVVLVADLFYQGKTVILDHGYGLQSLYAHLSETLVAEGQRVTQGTVLGKVGATGRVTGPHLHWAVKAGGARVDPFSLTALDLRAWLE